MTSLVDGAELIDAARRAVDAAQERPAEALDTALDILARAGGVAEARAYALWAAGLAARDLNDLVLAERQLRAAVTEADALRLDRVCAGARTSLALVLLNTGRPDDALRELDHAESIAVGAERGRVLMQRGLVRQRQGDLTAAFAAFDTALPLLAAGGDELAETRLRINRGVALAYRDELAAAREDLERAAELAARLDKAMLAATCAHNLGFVHGRRGDFPAALGAFDRAAALYAELHLDAGYAAVLLVDRAQVLLDAGLIREAVAAAARAVDLLAPTGNSVELAEAHLLQARALLAAEDRGAAGAGEAAAVAFTAQGRESWAVLADYVRVTASAGSSQDAAALARRLDAAGWTVEASSAHSQAARRALAAGDEAAAMRELDEAARSRDAGPAAARVAGWHAAALGQQLRGDRRAARRAVRKGLDELHRHRATLGATDLRAHAAAYGARLAELSVGDALATGRPGDVLVAAESWRAGSLTATARPPADPELAELLGRLRAATAARRERPGPDTDRELRTIENRVRDVVRARPGSAAAGRAERLDRAALTAALGERVLVEWVEHAGELHALVVKDGRTRHVRLGAVQPAVDAIDSIRMCLHRLAVGRGSARSLAAARATLDAAQRDAAERLFGAFAATVRARELVLVPTGNLHATPWLALDVVRAVPTVVAPSARAWLAATGRGRRPGVLLAAGPDLPGASAEVAALARALPQATALPAPTVSDVLAALPSVGTAHLAAHGTFRGDNPQFSSLRMADGELTVYDLETLPRTPDVLVLSACDAAATGVRTGDELLGLSAAVLALGTTSLVAPSLPVPDDSTVDLMVALQRGLSEGHSAARALHAAVDAIANTDDRSGAAVRSFVVWGGG